MVKIKTDSNNAYQSISNKDDFNISSNLEDFRNDIKAGKAVVCNNDGTWKIEHWFIHRVRRLFGFENQRIAKIIEVFNQQLDKLEKIPVNVSDNDNLTFSGSATDFNINSVPKINIQKQNFENYIKTAKRLKKKFKQIHSSTVDRNLKNLAIRTAGLRYRIGINLGGVDALSEECSTDKTKLVKQAKKWKKHYNLCENKDIAPCEDEKLDQIAKYPKFVKLIKKDEKLRTEFFKWSLRDNNDIDAFIEFPATSMRIKTALIAGRIGRFRNQIKDENGQVAKLIGFNENGGKKEKVYQLPFQLHDENATNSIKCTTKMVNILDETQKVKLRGEYEVEIQEIFNTFAKKNDGVGDFDFLGQHGIANWNSFEHGYRDGKDSNHKFIKIDISPAGNANANATASKNWWEADDFPVLETLTAEDINLRYDVDSKHLKEEKPFGIFKATRENANMNIERTHGYLEILIPIKNKDGTNSGTYKLLPIGRYAKEYPTNILEKIFFLSNTVKGAVQYPDENHAYGQRQQASKAYSLNEDELSRLMEAIRKRIQQARDGNFIFQFGEENCMRFAIDCMAEAIPAKKVEFEKLFEIHLTETEPQVAPLKNWLKWARNLSDASKKRCVNCIIGLFAPWRGITVEETVVENGAPVTKKVKKTVSTSRLAQDHTLSSPSKLARDAVTNGAKITLGHMFVQQNVVQTAQLINQQSSHQEVQPNNKEKKE